MRTDPRKRAEGLVAKHDITSPPVDVRRIALAEGITVLPGDFSPDLSALLMYRRGRYVIGVNKTHPEKRQRFSIAHELGHFLLHGSVFHADAEKEEGLIMFRDDTSSRGIDPKEIEANAFAASLLMPTEMFRQVWTELGGDTRRIAERFQVSDKAVELRKKKLGLV